MLYMLRAPIFEKIYEIYHKIIFKIRFNIKPVKVFSCTTKLYHVLNHFINSHNIYCLNGIYIISNFLISNRTINFSIKSFWRLLITGLRHHR